MKKLVRTRHWARLLGILCLVLVTLSAAAPGAGAAGASPHECNGTLEGGVVNGDLVVPAEAVCTLRGTTITGDVRLAPTATLDADSARIIGNLWIGEQASGDLFDTHVGGDVEVRGTWALLDTFGGVIAGDVQVVDAERINLIGTTVNGGVRFERSRLFGVHRARIKGQVWAKDVEFAGIIESRVGGNLAIGGAREEARLCGSQVAGTASFEGNAGKVAIGGGAYRCTGNAIDGNLLVLQNTGGTVIFNNIVRDNLTCHDNIPAPMGGNNEVRGQKQGQCGGL